MPSRITSTKAPRESVLSALDASEAVEHIIVHTGQNYDYELNQIFFEDLGLRKLVSNGLKLQT